MAQPASSGHATAKSFLEAAKAKYYVGPTWQHAVQAQETAAEDISTTTTPSTASVTICDNQEPELQLFASKQCATHFLLEQ
jgi:hypothetical protein